MMKQKKNMLFLWIYIAGMLLLVFMDQITKILAENHLYGKKAFVIIDGVFELSYLRNAGAAWGMMSGKRTVFLIITTVMLLLITYVVVKLPVIKKMVPMEIVCVLLGAGAIGNFIDRLKFGYVRDFLYFKLINFPVFNVADCYVTISVIVFIILIFFVYKESDFDFLKLHNKKDNK